MPQTCKACGNAFDGNYCNECGEKVYTEKDKKLSHIFEEVVHFITHFEGSLFRTISTVFTRPGKLSLDYCNGIRKKYFKPISLFLMSVVIYLIFPVFHGLNLKLGTYMDRENGTYYRMAAPVVSKKMKEKSIDFNTLREEYDEKSLKVAKVFLLVYLPLAALVLWALFFKKRRYFYDHFILATEYVSVRIILVFLLMPVIRWLGMLINPEFEYFFEDSNQWLWIGVHSIFLAFVIAAFRRFYQQNWFWTILKSIVFLATFEFYIVFVYHLLLFYVVMLFI